MVGYTGAEVSGRHCKVAPGASALRGALMTETLSIGERSGLFVTPKLLFINSLREH